MKKILVATDLSSRSERAIQRGAQLASQFQAGLVLLSVVDDDQPDEMVTQEIRQATDILNSQAKALDTSEEIQAQVCVEAGDAFQKIIATAKALQADLLIMGQHRKQILKDVLTGTTLERVIRTGRLPVLMVNQEATAGYKSALLPVDMSMASARAVEAARSLGLLDSMRLLVLYAFLPMAKDMLRYVGAEEEHIVKHVGQTLQEARNSLDNFLVESGLDQNACEVILREGVAFQIINEVVESTQPDLLVIGTRGHSGFKRLLLGSVADAVLREIDRDILVVPSVDA